MSSRGDDGNGDGTLPIEKMTLAPGGEVWESVSAVVRDPEVCTRVDRFIRKGFQATLKAISLSNPGGSRAKRAEAFVDHWVEDALSRSLQSFASSFDSCECFSGMMALEVFTRVLQGTGLMAKGSHSYSWQLQPGSRVIRKAIERTWKLYVPGISPWSCSSGKSGKPSSLPSDSRPRRSQPEPAALHVPSQTNGSPESQPRVQRRSTAQFGGRHRSRSRTPDRRRTNGYATTPSFSASSSNAHRVQRPGSNLGAPRQPPVKRDVPEPSATQEPAQPRAPSPKPRMSPAGQCKKEEGPQEMSDSNADDCTDDADEEDDAVLQSRLAKALQVALPLPDGSPVSNAGFVNGNPAPTHAHDNGLKAKQESEMVVTLADALRFLNKRSAPEGVKACFSAEACVGRGDEALFAVCGRPSEHVYCAACCCSIQREYPQSSSFQLLRMPTNKAN